MESPSSGMLTTFSCMWVCVCICFICGTCGHWPILCPVLSCRVVAHQHGLMVAFHTLLWDFASGVDYLRLNRQRAEKQSKLWSPRIISARKARGRKKSYQICEKYRMDKSLNKWEGNYVEVCEWFVQISDEEEICTTFDFPLIETLLFFVNFFSFPSELEDVKNWTTIIVLFICFD